MPRQTPSSVPPTRLEHARFNEGRGRCPAKQCEIDEHGKLRIVASMKGGADAPPNPHLTETSCNQSPGFNEGRGRCPAKPPHGRYQPCDPNYASMKGGADAPPNLIYEHAHCLHVMASMKGGADAPPNDGTVERGRTPAKGLQ